MSIPWPESAPPMVCVGSTYEPDSSQVRKGRFDSVDVTTCGGPSFVSRGRFDSYSSYDEMTKQPCEVIYNGRSPSGSYDAVDVQESQTDLLLCDLDTGRIKIITEDLELEDETPASKRMSLSSTRAWGGWWQEKRDRDERLWLAAGTGELAALQEALASSKACGVTVQVNSKGLGGRSALHIAATVGDSACVRFLLAAGAEIEAKTESGFTALHLACREGRTEAADILMAWGSDAEAEACDQSLAAHMAAAQGHLAVLRLLLAKAGLQQLRGRNSIGQRPVDLARGLPVQELLLSALGKDETLAAFAHDSYASRAVAPHLGVLMHNSRTDAVSRILRRTNQAAAAPGTMSHNIATDVPPGGTPPASPPSRAMQQHKGFMRPSNGFVVQEVQLDSFTPVSKLGAGSFGQVYKVVHKTSQMPYAMKMLDKTRICASDKLMRYTQTERNLMSYVKHPYIVQMHYAFQTPMHLIMVLEYCPRGSMQDLLERAGQLPEPLSKLYASEILLGLCYLHARNTVYRDMKPENIVLDAHGHAMITDFGLSKEDVLGLNGAKSFCGSWAFMAPEIVRRKPHGHTVDIYGLGVMTHCMLVGRPPFYNSSKEVLLDNIKHVPLRVPLSVPTDAQAFICATMVRNPQDRLGADGTEAIQDHAWFQGMDWDALMRREVPVPNDDGLFEPLAQPVVGVSESNHKAEAAFGQIRLAASNTQASNHIANWEFASAAPAASGC